MDFLHVDFETRSVIDLRLTGVYIYAAHESTDINCMAWAVGDGEVEIWFPWEPLPEGFLDAVKKGMLIAAFNAGFERLIWNAVLVRYGAPTLPVNRFYCVAANARSRGFPGALDKAARFAGIPQQKDMEGHALMMKLCKPRRIEEDGEVVWWEDHASHVRQGEYCKQDVRVERTILAMLIPFTAQELSDYHLSEEINDRGIMVDLELAEAAVTGAASEKLTADDVITKLTDGDVTACTQVAKILVWVEKEWKKLDSLNKSDVLDALQEDDIPPHVADVLELRLENAKAAVSKFAAMLSRSDTEGIVRGLFVFHGAGPGRFTSYGLQVQNLMAESNLEAIPILKKFGIPGLAMMGEPVKLLAQMVRPAFIAAPGKTFLVGDYAQVEARNVAWLAGEEQQLALFRQGISPYSAFGTKVLGKPVTKNGTPTEYKVFKACIAEGELVLTDRGLIPIQQIQRWHRVWDGVEWVHHDGLVYRGEQEVVTYEGVTATPDHRVYLRNGSTCEFGWAKAQGLKIASTGNGRQAVGLGRDFIDDCRDWAPSENLRAVCELQSAKVGRFTELKVRCYGWLSSMFAAPAYPEMVGSTSYSHEAAVHQPEGSSMEMVWGSGYRVPFLIGAGSWSMDHAKPRVAQGYGAGPRQEQRPLRSGESALGDAGYSVSEPWGECVTSLSHIPSVVSGDSVRGQHTAPSTARRADLHADCGAVGAPVEQTKRRVWDLLNAGPRHRFTVSGKLVFNCILGLGFGGAEGALARSMKKEQIVLTGEQQTEYVQAYRNTYTKIKAFWYLLRDATLMAMYSKGTIVPVGPINYMYDGEHLWCRLPSGRLICYPYAKVVQDDWGDCIEYRRGNRSPKSGVMEWPVVRLWYGMIMENLAQGIAFDLLMGALRRLREWAVRMHVHDEIVPEVDKAVADELLEKFLAIMAEGEEWSEGLPIEAEGKTSDRYVK